MTKRKANEFLKSATGRKIRFNCWPEGKYAIPNGEWEATFNSDPYYWTFWAIDEEGVKRYWYIHKGFGEDNCGGNWELIKTFEDYLDLYHKED